jgi:hypothetical protein
VWSFRLCFFRAGHKVQSFFYVLLCLILNSFVCFLFFFLFHCPSRDTSALLGLLCSESCSLESKNFAFKVTLQWK